MGKGPDARDWGACYWFQNTRQPYYNALAAGDLDIFRPASLASNMRTNTADPLNT